MSDQPTSVPDPRNLPDVSALRVGVLGGTGEQGRGLARRLAIAGHEVVIGSRDAARAATAAAEIGFGVAGLSNEECARTTDVVIVAVPWEGHAALLRSLRDSLDGKVVVDGNHPLAGTALVFDVEVAEVRPASTEELEHGHVHGDGGHQH